MTDTPIGPLLQTVFESILEVFLICLAGYILATRGVLDRKTQKQLNRLNVSLFTPSLLFSKVAFFLSPAKLRELWIIPIFFVVTTGVSMTVAYVLGWMLRLKKSQRCVAYSRRACTGEIAPAGHATVVPCLMPSQVSWDVLRTATSVRYRRRRRCDPWSTRTTMLLRLWP